MWTLQEAVNLCVELESFMPKLGLHVALTGGTLYKDGVRKDLDIVLYRIRQITLEEVNLDEIVYELGEHGFYNIRCYGFCMKCDWRGSQIDFLFPEPPGAFDAKTGYPVELSDNAKKHPDPLVQALVDLKEIGQD
jgi:hypothetical protein